MEYKIGEIFEYNGEWYQCVKSSDCPKCDLKHLHNCNHHFHCSTLTRKDGEEVIFKKLEKVGEPFPCRNMSFGCYGIIVQRYKVFAEPILTDNSIRWCDSVNQTILIALNNKEDMEENNNAKHSNSENIGKNFKPFDLQSAKSGKPVCTRDGRKARIICFDSKSDPRRPIIALIDNGNNELLYEYTINGKEIFSHISTTGTSDLMMLPEKKEGWVNIDKGGSGKITISSPYSTKEEAIHNDNETTIDTIKIYWKE